MNSDLRLVKTGTIAVIFFGWILFGGCANETEQAKIPAQTNIDDPSLPPPDPPPPSPYKPRPQNSLTFAGDIAPIVFQKCSTCHHPGEVAPFSLLTYQDVEKRGKQIIEVIQSKIMPPWSPVAGYCEFDNDSSLSVEQAGMFSQWVEEGMLEGDPDKLPPPPVFPTGWKHGTPDLVVKMPEPFHLPAETIDIFRKFVIRVPIQETRYVRAIDFDPGNRNVVHHMRLRVDRSGMSRAQDRHDPEPGFDGIMITGDEEPDGLFIAWVPGYEDASKPGSMTWRLEKGMDLLLELHLRGTGKPESIQSSIALYFTPTPPSDRLYTFKLENQNIDIPPGQENIFYTDQYVLPVDLTFLSAWPHAHFLARDFWSYAILPDGRKIWLMRIADWDFDWQRNYTYTQPISLPKGTTICMKIRYDNSLKNLRNPSNPPQRVLIGRETLDEMATIVFQVQTSSPKDRNTLIGSLSQKTINSEIGKEIFLIERGQPTSQSHYNLGCYYTRMNNLQKAFEHYQESLRINPKNIFSANNLGGIYVRLGKLNEARDEYAKVLQIDPEDFRARNNLGFILMNQGQLDKAAIEFEKVLSIHPEFVEAETNLGLIAANQGRIQQAKSHFERALKTNPNFELAKQSLIRTEELLKQQTKFNQKTK